ncbi:hypothetical protein [Microcella sp.]|uniref:hypothetical protein n=1 Tax=Microcella sp. TaxID=1913979 RepID=UPI003F6F9F3F
MSKLKPRGPWRTSALVAASVLATSILASCATPGEHLSAVTDRAEGTEVMQETLDQAWREVVAVDPGAVRPDVELIRLVSLDEWAPTTASCLADEGFKDVTIDASGQGVLVGDLAEAQRSAYQLALYVCAARYPLDPKYNEPLDEAQMKKLYEYYVNELSTCLRELGYEPSPAPSLQGFIDSYASDPWLPWVEASLLAAPSGPNATAELETRCPQLPPDLW